MVLEKYFMLSSIVRELNRRQFEKYECELFHFMYLRISGTRKNGPRKNLLQKLFSVKKMLGNLKDFSFLSIDSTTHTKICLTFTSRSYICTKLSNTKRVQEDLCSSFGFS